MEFDPTGEYGETDKDEKVTVFLVDTVKKELDYLAEYWELKNRGEIIMWAVKLLEDLSRMDEKGVKTFFVKCQVDESGKVIVDDSCMPALVPLLAMRPNNGQFTRVPATIAESKIVKKVRKPRTKKKKPEGDKSI